MTETDAETVTAEVRDILTAGGALAFFLKPDALGYGLAARFPVAGYPEGKGYFGHAGPATEEKPGKFETPQALASHFVEEARAQHERNSAMLQALIPNVVPHRAVGLAQESEEGAEKDVAEQALALEGALGGADVSDQPEAVAESAEQAEVQDPPPPTIDATLHAEIADEPQAAPAEDFAGTVIQAGDPLEAWRSQRIGDVARLALTKTPIIDDAKLGELRNYVQGVAEGRWDASASVQAQLDAMEAMNQRAGRISAFAKAQTLALLTGSRPFIETYKAEDLEWPE